MEKIVGNFALVLLHSVTNMRLLHWLVIDKSYAAHKASGEYCEQMPDLIDSLIETIMGGDTKFVPVFASDYYVHAPTTQQEMTDLLDFIKESRQEMPQESDVQNLIDEITALVKDTRYLLRAP